MELRQMTFEDESEEYKAFVEKFKPKKTTDDCYTPPEVFNCVADWASKRYGFPLPSIVRPFWPGGDYVTFDYPKGCVVVDNPPFSILSKIVRFFQANGILFFLFCPGLMLTSLREGMTLVSANCGITYENGANVRTNFITNLSPYVAIETAPALTKAVKEICDKLRKEKKKNVRKVTIPPEILTAAKAGWLSEHGERFSVSWKEATLIRKCGNYKIFGGGLLLSSKAAAAAPPAERAAAERAAAERAAAERAAAEIIQLGQKEKEIQEGLDRQEEEEESR